MGPRSQRLQFAFSRGHDLGQKRKCSKIDSQHSRVCGGTPYIRSAIQRRQAALLQAVPQTRVSTGTLAGVAGRTRRTQFAQLAGLVWLPALLAGVTAAGSQAATASRFPAALLTKGGAAFVGAPRHGFATVFFHQQIVAHSHADCYCLDAFTTLNRHSVPELRRGADAVCLHTVTRPIQQAVNPTLTKQSLTSAWPLRPLLRNVTLTHIQLRNHPRSRFTITAHRNNARAGSYGFNCTKIRPYEVETPLAARPVLSAESQLLSPSAKFVVVNVTQLAD
ncbi:hypothetical protein GWK47_027641 [Chionoecetes opilio]|uniref:Uncharacterized protein n=1 Tax=Chionoecetes opilio TaxID=41210 RepID=A0A8J8WBJ8_CHIOP|nr:hypothetical protein GWK47_027641 [Chionoecetes opilio]